MIPEQPGATSQFTFFSGDSMTSDLLFLAAPPIGGSGGGLFTVLRQQEPPHGAGYHVQMKHCVTLAQRQTMKCAE